MRHVRAIVVAASFAAAALVSPVMTGPAMAVTTQDLDKSSDQALATLYKLNPIAEAMSKKAVAIMVFPNIVKAGLVFGGAYGEGEMLQDGKVTAYLSTVTGSWGYQAGAQSYGYVTFLMTQKAVDTFTQSKGWEFGVGPSVVVVDSGVAANLSTSTLKDDAYAFIFNQQGLMAAVSLEGTKISRIKQ